MLKTRLLILPYGLVVFSHCGCPEMQVSPPPLATDGSRPPNPFHKEILEPLLGKSTECSSKMGVRQRLPLVTHHELVS